MSKSTTLPLLRDQQLSIAIQDRAWIFKSFYVKYPERQGLGLCFFVICSRALSPCSPYQLIQNGCTVLRALQTHKKVLLMDVKIICFYSYDCVWMTCLELTLSPTIPSHNSCSSVCPCSCSHKWSPTVTPLPGSSMAQATKKAQVLINSFKN